MATHVQVQDELGLLVANLNLDDATMRHPAIDIVFAVIGHERPEALVDQGVLPAGELDALKGIQRVLFDRDAEGFFIREGVSITANGRDVNPDAPLASAFAGGVYKLVVSAPGGGMESSQHEQMKRFAQMMLLHQTAIGHGLDVTKDYPELADVMAEAERQNQLEIDIPTATYKLTAEGKRVHSGWMDEAQDLIKRYDVFGDVVVDAQGKASFDSGLGQDWRVPMFDLDGVDPFRARFLLGLNDGEWDNMSEWRFAVSDPAWYGEVFAPVEAAPTVDELGRDRMMRAREQAVSYLRTQSATY